MAIKGLSYMVAGKYGVSSSAISISEGKVLGKAVSYQISLNSPTSNNLYGDNEIAESDNQQFAGGTLTLGLTGISPANEAWMRGITVREEGTGTTVDWYDDDDNTAPIEMAVGFIELHQENNVNKYKPIVLWRTKPGFVSSQANTKGETVEWQTPTVDCEIMRATVGTHRWRSKGQYFDTEAEAIAELKTIFGISA